MSQNEQNALVQMQFDKIFAARKEFFAALDAAVVKDGKFALSECENEAVKALYKAFYEYDYNFRRLMPVFKEKFGVKTDV